MEREHKRFLVRNACVKVIRLNNPLWNVALLHDWTQNEPPLHLVFPPVVYISIRVATAYMKQ